MDEWYFEDLVVGVTATSRSRAVSETDMNLLPIMIGATNPSFMSDRWSLEKHGREGGRYAASLIPVTFAWGLAHQTGLLSQLWQVLEWKIIELNHNNRLKRGSVVSAEVRVTDRDDDQTPGHGSVTLEIVLHRDDGAPVVRAVPVISVRKRAGDEV